MFLNAVLHLWRIINFKMHYRAQFAGYGFLAGGDVQYAILMLILKIVSGGDLSNRNEQL